ncbi:MAG TPA: flavin reductase family protein [Chloroflexia bacterium]|nr:flavin reductase family protein [Chloroflexia bacterium]
MKRAIPRHFIHRVLGPGPVVLVTAQVKGHADVSTLAWAMPLSGDPPLVAIAVEPLRHLHDLITHSDEFTINVPHAGLLREVQHCGTVSGADHDKFAETGLHALSARQVEAPWIDECVAHLECGVVGRSDQGDHTLFVAEVLAAWADEAAFAEQWLPENEAGRLLHHLGGRLYTVGDRPIDAGAPPPAREE